MKLILSYSSESNSCAVDKAVRDEDARDVFRSYLKERATALLCLTDDEAEELLETDDAVEDGLSYNKEACAATILMPDGSNEVLNLVDAPEIPVSDKAYCAKEEEKRAEDVIKYLKKEIGLEEDCSIPEKLKDSWQQTAEAAVHIFDRISGFNDHYWDIYWGMIREAAEQAKKQVFGCHYSILQMKREKTDLLFLNYEQLEKNGIVPTISDYYTAYTGEESGDTDKEILDQLYVRFNIERPIDFKGHSLSVSDVVAIKRKDSTRFYYVDSVDFKELHGFADEKNKEE